MERIGDSKSWRWEIWPPFLSLWYQHLCQHRLCDRFPLINGTRMQQLWKQCLIPLSLMSPVASTFPFSQVASVLATLLAHDLNLLFPPTATPVFPFPKYITVAVALMDGPLLEHLLHLALTIDSILVEFSYINCLLPFTVMIRHKAASQLRQTMPSYCMGKGPVYPVQEHKCRGMVNRMTQSDYYTKQEMNKSDETNRR